MTCEHTRLQFGCDSCRAKVKIFENNIDFYLYEIERIKKDLEAFYEEDDCPDSIVSWLDGAIANIEHLLLEISREAELNQSKRHFSNLVRAISGLNSHICSDRKPSKR